MADSAFEVQETDDPALHDVKTKLTHDAIRNYRQTLVGELKEAEHQRTMGVIVNTYETCRLALRIFDAYQKKPAFSTSPDDNLVHAVAATYRVRFPSSYFEPNPIPYGDDAGKDSWPDPGHAFRIEFIRLRDLRKEQGRLEAMHHYEVIHSIQNRPVVQPEPEQSLNRIMQFPQGSPQWQSGTCSFGACLFITGLDSLGISSVKNLLGDMGALPQSLSNPLAVLPSGSRQKVNVTDQNGIVILRAVYPQGGERAHDNFRAIERYAAQQYLTYEGMMERLVPGTRWAPCWPPSSRSTAYTDAGVTACVEPGERNAVMALLREKGFQHIGYNPNDRNQLIIEPRYRGQIIDAHAHETGIRGALHAAAEMFRTASYQNTVREQDAHVRGQPPQGTGRDR